MKKRSRRDMEIGRLVYEVCRLSRQLREISLIRPLPPLEYRMDGVHILAVYQPKWAKEPEWRIVHWNNGIGKCAYTSPCWMCSVCTISIDEDAIKGWLPLPIGPWHVARAEEDHPIDMRSKLKGQRA